MSEHDVDADGLSLSETEARLLRAYFEAYRGYTVSDQTWERMQRDFTNPLSMAGEQRRRDMRVIKATLEALSPGDRLPGGGVWAPEEPTDVMLIAALEAFLKEQPPMPSPVQEGQEIDAYEAAQRLMALGARVRNSDEMAAVYRAMLASLTAAGEDKL